MSLNNPSPFSCFFSSRVIQTTGQSNPHMTAPWISVNKICHCQILLNIRFFLLRRQTRLQISDSYLIYFFILLARSCYRCNLRHLRGKNLELCKDVENISSSRQKHTLLFTLRQRPAWFLFTSRGCGSAQERTRCDESGIWSQSAALSSHIGGGESIER